MSAPLTDLFRRYTTPPSPFHEVVQEAARQAGWTPPWDREDKQKKQKAAKIGGIKRRLLPEWRRTIVLEAHRRLRPKHQINPYAKESINALFDGYCKLVAEGCEGNPLAQGADDFLSLLPELLSALPKTDQEALQSVGRETLLKDMKALNIRSKCRTQRAG